MPKSGRSLTHQRRPINGTLRSADYAVSQILNEAFPTEVQTLYEQYSESFAAGQSLINLDELVLSKN